MPGGTTPASSSSWTARRPCWPGTTPGSGTSCTSSSCRPRQPPRRCGQRLHSAAGGGAARWLFWPTRPPTPTVPTGWTPCSIYCCLSRRNSWTLCWPGPPSRSTARPSRWPRRRVCGCCPSRTSNTSSVPTMWCIFISPAARMCRPCPSGCRLHRWHSRF